jgi:DNA-binding NarL/FixJ family response regulator
MKKLPDKPPVMSPKQATGKRAAASATIERMGTRISIVEDDAEALEILADWLNATPGFQCVSTHGDGLSAVQELPDIRPEIVLMDINLPGLKGIECVRRLKPLMPDTQFLMLTVYGDTDSILQALEAGAIGYLLKRTSRDELFAALKLVQAGGSPISSSIARRVWQIFQNPLSVATVCEELSVREQQVLELLSHGHPEKQIADRLKISQHTVHTYIRRIYEKLHVHSHAQAVAKYAVQSTV